MQSLHTILITVTSHMLGNLPLLLHIMVRSMYIKLGLGSGSDVISQQTV